MPYSTEFRSKYVAILIRPSPCYAHIVKITFSKYKSQDCVGLQSQFLNGNCLKKFPER